MIHDCLGFFEPRQKNFTLDTVPDRGCHFISGTLAAVIGATAASIAGPVIIGAGVGALGAAVTGGDPGQGALFGGILGGAGGALGAFGGDAIGGAADAAGGAAGLDPLSIAPLSLPGGALTTQPINSLAADGSVLSGGTSGALSGAPLTSAAGSVSTLNPLSAIDSTTLTGGSGSSGSGSTGSSLGGIGKSLVGLAALSSLSGAGSQAPVALPGPSSTAATQGPYFNAPLQYQGQPSRNPINPYASNPAGYATAGQRGEQTYFGNNSLLNFYNPSVAPAQVIPPPTTYTPGNPAIYAAHGGQPQSGALALMRGGDPSRFSTAHGENFVRGGGDGTSDSVPAQLSDGEYVLTAADVSRLGSGDNNAGAKKLDQFRADLARKAGQKQFVPAKVKGALSGLGKAA